MNCKEVQNNLLEDLTSRFNESVADHLDGCSECKSLCQDLMELEDLSSFLQHQVSAPPDFRLNVLSTAKKVLPRWMFSIGPALAFVILITVSAGVLAFWDSPSVVPGGALVVDNSGESLMIDYEISEIEIDENLEYVDIVQETPDGQVILRVPSVIEVRRTELHEESEFRNVSY
jgi:hypothetical protein